MKPSNYTHIYVIESLRPNDLLTGTELFNDIILRRLSQKGMEANSALFNVTSKHEFFECMEKIQQAAIFELANPMVHLEMHGNENGLQVSSGENISWEELQYVLLQINGICGNNLFISMATCKGGYIHKAINPSLWTPFWGHVGPLEEVSGLEILANYTSFYNEFLQSGDFNLAVEALNASNPTGFSRFRFHNTEFTFRKAYDNYEALYLTPEVLEHRLESMVQECRPLPEFNTWTDDRIKDFGRYLFVNQKDVLKKRLMRKFFMIDKFPEHLEYYPDLN